MHIRNSFVLQHRLRSCCSSFVFSLVVFSFFPNVSKSLPADVSDDSDLSGVSVTVDDPSNPYFDLVNDDEDFDDSLYVFNYGDLSLPNDEQDVDFDAFMKKKEEKLQHQKQALNDRQKDQSKNVSSDTSDRNFWEWLQELLGATTTTPKPVLDKPQNCEPCQCGVINRKRIVGGQETEVNQYPWMALLLYNGKFYCGGSLINDKYIMTAAHCTTGLSPEKISVRLMEHDRSTEGETEVINRKVLRVVRHPRYSNRNYNNDIALLRMDMPVSLKAPLRPVCMPTRGKSYSGYDGIVTGWGATEESGPVASKLQEVTVPIMSNAECRQTSYGKDRITDNMLCAGFPEGQKDSCQGDSGGPLHVVNGTTNLHQVVGIVSWGEGCAQADKPGVYTRVNRYLTWIKSNTADACYC